MIPKTYFSAPLSKSAKDAEGRIRNIFEGQRRRPAAFVLALVAAAALLCGSVIALRAKSAAASREQEETKAAAAAYAAQPAAEVASLPRFAYQGDDPYLTAVCDWITSEGKSFADGTVTIPCPLIVDVDDYDSQDIRIWGDFQVHNYKSVGTTLLTVSGRSQPGLLHLRLTNDGYEVNEMEAVEDGEGYGDSMRRIFGVSRMMKLDAFDRKTVRTQYIADYVLQNGLPFTQYQDYGWDPVHIPGTPETPEAAQLIRCAGTMGYGIDYDLREFAYDIPWDGRLGTLTGVGKLQGISICFEKCEDTDLETVIADREQRMEQPRRTESVMGADRIPATLLRDGVTRSEVIKDTYVVALNDIDFLTVTVCNTYYAEHGDPIVQGGKEALEKVLATFRLTERDVKAYGLEGRNTKEITVGYSEERITGGDVNG